MSSPARELRQDARSHLRVPGFSLAAAMILALGSGANTAIFSVTRAVRTASSMKSSHSERTPATPQEEAWPL